MVNVALLGQLKAESVGFELVIVLAGPEDPGMVVEPVVPEGAGVVFAELCVAEPLPVVKSGSPSPQEDSADNPAISKTNVTLE